MRTYPTNSAQAVSRLLALTMIVDGHLAPSELKAMRASGIPEHVSLGEEAFDEVVRELCEDLLASAARRCSAEVEIDSRLLDTLLAEVEDQALRFSVMKTMLEIVHADSVLDARETLLIQRAFKAWSIEGLRAA
ncbi:TerB family tellurite resistance protein [Massilia norwichensis]|uniref:TerB family tellurite resistance protein n=1 Tax=Massilia norwichensis TaxID=1442366 RepID=A0ABT2A9H1_9BURK|nr:TerB family tellurite resistance protein [Massilia norwichensis]MCS0590851.1 TerB family tellurite resistance protein [Massilia norwichensis]